MWCRLFLTILQNEIPDFLLLGVNVELLNAIFSLALLGVKGLTRFKPRKIILMSYAMLVEYTLNMGLLYFSSDVPSLALDCNGQQMPADMK